jgi:Protein of unknown function (DUF2852)
MNQSTVIRPEWTVATTALMVLGFIVFWPLGLAMLAYILFGDRIPAFKRNFADKKASMFSGCGMGRNHHRGPHFGTGNVAFDEWRNAELARMDEQRRKLDEMRAEFDDYMKELRRARDQEEFDRFMRNRKPSDGFDGVNEN